MSTAMPTTHPAELAGWLPGRTATAVKQAYDEAVLNNRVDLAALLQRHKWPADLCGLLSAWPGPPKTLQVGCREQGLGGLFLCSGRGRGYDLVSVEDGEGAIGGA
jgi:hypothetical protein